jgi:hypothetical protein
VFPNLRRMHKYWNLPLRKQVSFYLLASFPFREREIFPWEHGNKYNWGSSPAYHTRVLLLGEIPQNTQRNKKGVFYIVRFPYCLGLLKNLLLKFRTKILLLFNKRFQYH